MTTEIKEGKKPKLKTERQVLAWRKRVINKRLPSSTYRCVGGPFDGKEIVLTDETGLNGRGAVSAWFTVGECSGRYKSSFENGRVDWQSAQP
jgi:hypothetical protein